MALLVLPTVRLRNDVSAKTLLATPHSCSHIKKTACDERVGIACSSILLLCHSQQDRPPVLKLEFPLIQPHPSHVVLQPSMPPSFVNERVRLWRFAYHAMREYALQFFDAWQEVTVSGWVFKNARMGI
jgi:hypothetical protein